MSYLLKKNKKTLIFIRLLFIILISILFYNGLNSYIGNKLIYVVFSLLSSYLLFFAFRKNAIFFETFFSVLVWLGFWFKFTCYISFINENYKGETGNISMEGHYDETLIVSMVGISAIIVSGYIRELFFNYPRKIDFKPNYYKLYEKYRYFFLILFLILIVLVAFCNWNYEIYQRGVIPLTEYNPLFSGILKWLLLFGLSSIGTIILFLEGIAFKKIFILTFFIVSLEFFFSSSSMLSRGLIFNSMAVLYGLYKCANKLEIKFKIQEFITFLLIIVLLFYASVITVNSLRFNKFKDDNSSIYIDPHSEVLFSRLSSKINNNETTIPLLSNNSFEKSGIISIDSEHITYTGLGINTLTGAKRGINGTVAEAHSINTSVAKVITTTVIKKSYHEFKHLLIYRWIGIDGVMNLVSNRKILGYSLLKEAFNERLSTNNPTFYEKKFKLKDTNALKGIIFGDPDTAHAFTYISETSFAINNINLTSKYFTNRRVKIYFERSSAFVHGAISSSSFATHTIVNVTWDAKDIQPSNLISLKDETFIVYLAELNPTRNYATKNDLMLKGNTLMGIISFMFYSGSYIFLFFSIIGVCIFASFLEIAAYYFSSNNIIFSSLIGLTVAFRYIHFGFLPHQSYLLIGTILLNIVIIYLINKFLLKTCNYIK